MYPLSDENSSSPNDSKQESKVRFAFSYHGPAVAVAGSIYVAQHPTGLSRRLCKRLWSSAYSSLQATLPGSSGAQWPPASVGVLWAFWQCLWLLDQIRCGSQTQEIKNHGPVLIKKNNNDNQGFKSKDWGVKCENLPLSMLWHQVTGSLWSNTCRLSAIHALKCTVNRTAITMHSKLLLWQSDVIMHVKWLCKLKSATQKINKLTIFRLTVYLQRYLPFLSFLYSIHSDLSAHPLNPPSIFPTPH